LGLGEKILKALTEINLVNVQIDKSTKISLKQGSISIGDQTITDPELFKKLKTVVVDDVKSNNPKETLPYQIIHEDLLNDYKSFEEISKKNSRSLALLKEVLPTEEIECILVARRVKMAFDENNQDLAKEIFEKQLDKNYPKKGKKILNLIRAGYFDELIIPMIDIFKSQYGKSYPEKFREFYFNLLKFFPTAIFVSNTTTKEILEQEIKKRLKLKTVPLIRIHSMGSENIKKTNEVVEKIRSIAKIDLLDNRFVSSTGIEAQNLEVRIKNNYL